MTEPTRLELVLHLVQGATPEQQSAMDALLERFQVAAGELAMGPDGRAVANVVFGACMNFVMGIFAQAPAHLRAEIVLKTLELYQQNGADIHWLGVSNAPTLAGMETNGTKH